MHLLYLQQLLVLPGCPGNDRCWQFAQQWAAQGHRITFIATDALLPDDHPWKVKGRAVARFQEGNVTVYLLPIPYAHEMPFRQRVGRFLQFGWRAWKLAQQMKDIDKVLAYTAPLSVAELGRRVAKRLNVPFFLEVADVWPDVPIGMGIIRQRWLAHWLQRRTQRIYAEAVRIFPFSPGMADQIAAHGIPREKLHTFFNGTTPARIQSRVRGQVSTSPIRVVYTGTIGIANDVGQLLRAWKYIEAQGREDLHLTLLGSGNDAAGVRTLAQQLSLTHFDWQPTVPREQAISLLHDAEIGIVCFAPYPVLEANAATKFFDYLAAGLPVVLNYEGWQADFLREHACGLAAPQGDVAQFAQHILTLADDADLRAQYSRHARLLAEQLFDREKLGREMGELLAKG